MKATRSTQRRQKERGIALLIAIFVLLLIGVVAIALVVSSGTESALAGNYRSSTSVYYAASAGLEEVRARLRTNNPNSFNNTAPGFLQSSGTPIPVCAPLYVINPVGGEAVTPWNLGSAYADNEFGQEFGAICGAAPPNPSPFTQSLWNKPPLNGLPFPGPLYKWVRINGVSENSLNLDTCPIDGSRDPSLVYYGAAMPPPAALCNPNPPYLSLNDRNVGGQVLELTALAVLPNRSQKILQYLVAPQPIAIPLLAALTISGSNTPGGAPSFHAPANNAAYAVIGNDYGCNGLPLGGPPSKAAIGLFGDYSGGSYNQDLVNITAGIPTSVGSPPTNPALNYTGLGPAPPPTNPPDVEYLTTYPANMESPSQLDAMVQMITQNADVILPSGPTNYPLPTVSGSALSSLGMSNTNPMTVVINGNLDVTNWTGTGFGTLLVIGNFTYDPATTWNGIVLVIGQGQINNIDIGQFQQMNGAVFVAKTRDPGGNLIGGGKIGGASVSFSAAMQGNGIRYSSCWIAAAQPTSGYKILSFHEISQ